MTRSILVAVGDHVDMNQVIASAVRSAADRDLTCQGSLAPNHIQALLESRERTQRFTGVKLARLRNDDRFNEAVTDLSGDTEEDIYIRLEGLSYLAGVCGGSPADLFADYLSSSDPQTQLECVIAIGEVGSPAAVDLLSGILDRQDVPYFLRSAAAWSLGVIGSEMAIERLVRAFGDIDRTIREEALEGIVSIGGPAIPVLLSGLRGTHMDVAAGCAEALRQRGGLPDGVITEIAGNLHVANPPEWAVWLMGQLPRERVAPTIVGLQDTAPQLHYAISLLWAFTESWIARRWEVYPGPRSPNLENVEGA